MARLLALLLLLALPATAEEVVLGLSADEVAISATFDGEDILIFGAVKREEPIPQDSTLGVIVTVEGPSEPLTVRRKDRVAIIWANVDAVEVDAAPSFYAVATSGPMTEVLTQTEDLRHAITIPRVIRAVGVGVHGGEDFTNALIRIRAGQNLYQVREGEVQLDQDTLFRTRIDLPAALTEGSYRTRIFLTRNGEVVDIYETAIAVNKVGLERWLHETSRNQPLLYGLMSLAIAIAAGWMASAAFQLMRR